MADRVDDLYHNHPFDLDVDHHGRIWFSDPYSSIPAPGPQIFPPLDFCAVLRQEPSHGESRQWVIRRMTSDTNNPGAILLSKYEQFLYVMEWNSHSGNGSELRAYPLQDDGSLETPTILQTFSHHSQESGTGLSGMCLDSEGNIIACGRSNAGDGEPTVFVYSPNGALQEHHPVPGDHPTNCGFGGPDLQSLYVTTQTGKLFRIDNTNRQG